MTILSDLPPNPPLPPPSPSPPRSHSPPATTSKPDRPLHTPKKYKKPVNPSKFVNTPPDPLYIFEDGLRRVTPYYFTYNTYCKYRWRDRSLLEIFLDEFRDRPEEYYVRLHSPMDRSIPADPVKRKAIENGTVCVTGMSKNGTRGVTRSGLDTIVKNGDMISHTLHRHEPPVSGKSITVVFEDENIIAIDKPAGVPVHPTGRYNYNSLTEIMRHDRGDFNPLPCNRLDRLTSGLMFIAKHRKAADDFTNLLRTRNIRKQYVARVKGEFPEGDIICEEPILLISPKLGLNRVKADGKYAKTLFRRMKYDAAKNYSIIECHPLTGRTHQIRVHLQFLGHPIANDPIYCNRRVWGPTLGRGGEGEDEDIITRLNRMGKEEVAEAEAFYNELVDDYQKQKAEKMLDKKCELCETPLYSDPGPHELGIYLHARKYSCEEPQWSYETPLPNWALEE